MNTMSLKPKETKNKRELKTFDDKLTQDLFEVIEELTHTGEKTLNLDKFKKIKDICKHSAKYIREAYNMIIENLAENHAEVRLSAFQICDEIFRKSHCFREQVILNLEQIVKLTTGESLPPPKAVARELKRSALRTIHEWNEQFGGSYKKLSLGYNYLCQVEKVDFNALEIVDAATQAREREIKRRQEAIHAVRIKKVLAEVKEKEFDIKTTCTSLSNCINLLLPHPDDFFIKDVDMKSTEETQPMLATHQLNTFVSDDNDSTYDVDDVGRREVGMVNINHSIEFNFTPSSKVIIEENVENAVVIENAREYARLIDNRYLPSVIAWLEVLSKSSGHKEEQKCLVELKGDLDDVMFKYGRITFISADDVSSDSDLEEVPSLVETKPDTELLKSADPTIWSILSGEELVGRADLQQKPECSTSTQEEVSISDRKQKLLSLAPKLPFDVDLYHWEDDKLPVPTLVPSSTEGHRFWVNSESCMDELPVPEGSAALRTRVIEFTGSFSQVTHSCRVRLPSGKLCPRQDRFKCPFHGEIVARDYQGNCINPKDAERMQALAEKRQQEKPDWQDPKLLAEIKKTTGIDLKMPVKGKRKKKKKEYPGLTDLKASENTVTKRLEKKIFKTSVMRKVASSMDKMDQRKFMDKFGDQFQYFYKS